ncbi:MAG: hypothetical protein BAJATHORv1_20353 [Candidatus Thorarchaeota archaeon]|nr:MAG: hypothetical protein BAJATHORv1_20353 [Candidatus Thorarchaeota archaeon]
MRFALVTGCFGFIGSHLVEKLIENQYYVYGVGTPRIEKQDNFSSFIDSSHFDLLQNDITKIDTDFKLPKNIDVIFHLAVRRNKGEPLLLSQVNVTGTVRILELARLNKIKRFVFSSSAAVYGISEDSPITEKTNVAPQNIYASSKLAAERFIDVYTKRYGLEAVILRYFNVFGPRQAENHGAISIFINQALRGGPITLEGDGKYQYTPIYVTDLVEATLQASQKPNQSNSIINICGTEILQINQIAQKILEKLHKKKSKIIFRPPRANWGSSHIGSTDSMRKLLDFSPQWNFDEALDETIEWYRQKRK